MQKVKLRALGGFDVVRLAGLVACAVLGCDSQSSDRAVPRATSTAARAAAPDAAARKAPAKATPGADVRAGVPSDTGMTPEQIEEATRGLQAFVVESHAGKVKVDDARPPERLARGMTGTFQCGKRSCRAGRQVCVFSPAMDAPVCKAIVEWVSGHTPVPEGGLPPLAGVTACGGSSNCPPESVCCLHEIGNADVQAVVCHASLAECRDGVELCQRHPKDCRTPGTRCEENQCIGPR